METTARPLTAEDLIDFETGTPQAKALCFLYTNSEYGFKPAEVGEQTALPRNTASKGLSQLWEKDLINKTADGYYHALDDPIVANHSHKLKGDRDFTYDTGKDEYPADM